MVFYSFEHKEDVLDKLAYTVRDKTVQMFFEFGRLLE